MNVNNLTCHTQISSLCLYENKLFIGCGKFLEIFLKEKLLFRKKIFQNFNICGIKIVNKNSTVFVIINGNRFLSLFKFDIINEDIFDLKLIIKEINFNDWILETDYVENEIYCILTSNKLGIYNLTNNVLKIINCEQSCTLYTGKFLFSKENSISLAAGTVFSEILICEYTNDKCILKEKLCGHEGVIFTIDYNLKFKILASGSDDRTIRLWKHNLEKDSFEFIKILYGHESRIWQVCLSNDCIISSGENSSLYFWSYNYECLFKEKLKNVSYWKLVLNEEKKILYYSGSDGSVKGRSIKDILNDEKKFELLINQPKSLKFFNTTKDKLNEKISLFLTNNDGKGFQVSFKNENFIFEKEYSFGKEYSDFNVLALNKNNEGVLGNKKGEITHFIIDSQNKNLNIVYKDNLISGKIFNLLFLENSIVTCGLMGSLKIWLSKNSTIDLKLPYSKEQWINCIIEIKEKIFIVGDRCGNVIVYNKNGELIKNFKQIHGCNGVKDLKKHKFKPFFYSCGRDGRVVEYIYQNDQVDLLRVVKIEIEMDWIGQMIFDEISGDLKYLIGFISTKFVVWNEITQCIVWALECGGGHRPWDFTISSNKFFFSYIKKNKLICLSKDADQTYIIKKKFHSKAVLCGQILNTVLNKIYFLTGGEDNNLIISSFNINTFKTCIETYLSGHISNTRTCAVEEDFNNLMKKSYLARSILCTAGGRSQLMVWEIILDLNKSLIVKQILNYFIWNTDKQRKKPWKEKIDLIKDPQIRFMDLKLSKLDHNLFLISSICSDSSLKIFYLSINEKSIQLIKSISLSQFCPLKLISLNKFYLVSFTNGDLELFEKNLIKLCKIKSSLVSLEPLETIINDKISDNSDIEIKKISLKNIQQFGINSIELLELTKNEYLVFCVGEDTSLNYFFLFYKDNDYKFSNINKVESNHCSMISKVKMIDNKLLVTTSWDKRIKIWNFKIDNQKYSLQMVCSKTIVSSISDISELQVFKNKEDIFLLVFGEGYEVYKINQC